MKYLLLLICFNVYAGNEISAQYLRINQSLFNTIKFESDAAGLEYSYIHDTGLGARIGLARGTETKNTYELGVKYTNKIEYMYNISAMYRFNINDDISCDLSVGKNDYKTSWTVDGVEPDWSGNSDSDWVYSANINYKIDDYSLTIGYRDLYRKEKEGFGREETKAFYLGVNYAL